MSPRGSIKIPGAPAPALLIELQRALCERVETVILYRALDDAAPESDLRALTARLGGVNQRLVALRAQATFPLDLVARTLRLDVLDLDTLALAAAPHLDTSIREHLVHLRGPGRGYVDGALALRLFCTSREQQLGEARRFAGNGALVAAGLIEHVRPPLGHTPSALEYELVPTPRLLGLLRGELVIDPRLNAFAELVETHADDGMGVAPPELLAELAMQGRQLFSRSGKVLLRAPAGIGELGVAAVLARAAGCSCLLVADWALLAGRRDFQESLRLLEREASIGNAMIVLHEVSDASPTFASSLRRLRCPAVVTTPSNDSVFPPIFSRIVEVPHPDARTRAHGWRAEAARRSTLHAIGSEADGLAREYPLPRPAIARALDHARDAALPAIRRAAQGQLSGQLARFAERSRVRAHLADVVLAEDLREQVVEIIHAARNRTAVLEAGFGPHLGAGRSIAALFNGPSGTGKTFTANVIATELDMPLYRIDVSRVVDRYIGETEKRLAQIFEEAASDRAVLLFDEADSLFSRRVNVQDATDRYSNMQVNLLLQLVEEYDGFIVLTTNLKASMDTAFMRRIAYKVTFAPPEQDERLSLWKIHCPAGLPLEPDVDLAALSSSYRTTGGEIKNAILRAAFAAGVGGTISMSRLRRAISLEMEAAGNVVKRDDGRAAHR